MKNKYTGFYNKKYSQILKEWMKKKGQTEDNFAHISKSIVL
jgi:hypothetical protein